MEFRFSDSFLLHDDANYDDDYVAYDAYEFLGQGCASVLRMQVFAHVFLE